MTAYKMPAWIAFLTFEELDKPLDQIKGQE